VEYEGLGEEGRSSWIVDEAEEGWGGGGKGTVDMIN
jgi:hypothetical protein